MSTPASDASDSPVHGERRPVTIVTGGSRGIGAATCRTLGRRGHAVIVNFAAGRNAALDVVGDIERGGGRAVAVHADVASESDVVAMFDEAEALFGHVTGLVNNAGTAASYGPVADLDAAATTRMLMVNVLGPLLCCREAVRRMEPGSAIVNVSSGAARIGGANEWVDYASSKGAVDTMTLGLAREVAAKGIRVNAVRPGLIETDFNDHATPGRLERVLAAGTVSMGRAGSPDEVAATIAWLLSDGASYVTAAIVDVTGGR
jgi:NAD(P)-dependent dehydrogenase (short-subunit alcohol dehydrogenase family)